MVVALDELANQLRLRASRGCADGYAIPFDKSVDECAAKAIERMVEALDECEDYFDNRADADCDQDGFIPNAEMRLLSLVRQALSPTPAPKED